MPESLLEMAERHVRLGERLVARQREIVAAKRQGKDGTEMSEQLLKTFEASLALHRAHLEWLLRPLPANTDARPGHDILDVMTVNAFPGAHP